MHPSRNSAGFAMVEAMVTVVVVAFGLLGIAGLVSRSFVTEVEGTQRTQAMMLLQDMASRIEANRANVSAYVTGSTAITGGAWACTQPTLAQRDLCQWGRLLAGANEALGMRNAGVLVGARGCIFQVDSFNRIYAISIAWEGMTTGPAPIVGTPASLANECGRGMFGAGNENRRRVMTLPVRLGTVGS
jgi:type IV pilus assembly protein PilV